MRDLFVTSDFPPTTGGVARLYGQLCAAAPQDGLVILTPRYPGDRASDAGKPYQVARVRAPVGLQPLQRIVQIAVLLLHTARVLARQRIGRIHVGHLHLGVIGLAMRLLRRPYVLYLHGGEMADYMRFRPVRIVARAIIRHAHTVVVNSEFTQRYYKQLGMAHPHTEVLGASVNTSVFHPGLDGQPIRARYDLDGEPVLLTVGRIVERKGHDTVIRALPLLRERIGPVRYVIVGTGVEEQRLKALAADIGCQQQVVFAGYVPEEDLPLFYAACDLFVMPSRVLPGRDGIEGYGIVFLEAAASGKAVVGGRTGGIDEAVINGVTGILTDPDDLATFAEIVAGLLRNHERRKQLGREGRHWAVAREQEWARAVTTLWNSHG